MNAVRKTKPAESTFDETSHEKWDYCRHLFALDDVHRYAARAYRRQRRSRRPRHAYKAGFKFGYLDCIRPDSTTDGDNFLPTFPRQRRARRAYQAGERAGNEAGAGAVAALYHQLFKSPVNAVRKTKPAESTFDETFHEDTDYCRYLLALEDLNRYAARAYRRQRRSRRPRHAYKAGFKSGYLDHIRLDDDILPTFPRQRRARRAYQAGERAGSDYGSYTLIALAAARDDPERARAERDAAMLVIKADIGVDAADVVARAERSIIRANPPAQGERRDRYGDNRRGREEPDRGYL